MTKMLFGLAVYAVVLALIGGGVAGVALDLIEGHERINIRQLHERIEGLK